MLSGVPPTCFSLFSCCRESRQRVFLCFCAVGGPANVFFFVFVLSGVPPTCFSLFLCCRDPRRDVFFRIFIIGHHIADRAFSPFSDPFCANRPISIYPYFVPYCQNKTQYIVVLHIDKCTCACYNRTTLANEICNLFVISLRKGDMV